MRKSFFVCIFGACLALSAVSQTTPAAPGQTPDKTQPSQPVPEPTTTVAGKWKFVFDTEGGDRTYVADFQQNGEKVSGKWENKEAVKGTFSKGKLALEFPYTSEEVGEGTLKVDGQLTDVLKGSWSFQTYSGTFTATREKP